MRKTFIFILLAIFFSGISPAKKNPTIKTRLKEAYYAHKDNKGHKDAIKNLLAMIDTSNVSVSDKAKAYLMIAQLEEDVNDAENLKAYLKEKCDTATIFSSALDIQKYCILCDTFDHKGIYDRQIKKMMEKHHLNVYNGGRYYMRKQKWNDAINFFDVFLATHKPKNDSLTANASYYATVCAVNINKPEKVLKYVEKAIELAPVYKKPILAEYEAKSILATTDSLQWINFVEKNEKKYVGNKYFFINLIDWYIHHGQYEKGLERTDGLMNVDGEKIIYWYAKSLLAIYKHDFKLAVEVSRKCLELEPDNPDANYNLGISLCNLAVESNNKVQIKEYYKEALEPMEKFRKLCPDNIKLWGNPLYRIYLNLNMGKKFDEIDNLLKVKGS